MQIAVKAKAKNGMIQRVLDSRGWTQKKLAAELGIDQTAMGRYINFQQIPREQKIIDAFERVLRLPIEMIFPAALRDPAFKTLGKEQTRYYSVSDDMLVHSTVDMITHNTAEDISRNSERIEQLRRVVRGLPEREAYIIDQRFGLTDGHTKTLQAIGDILGISRDRVRQIECRALRRMRYPAYRRRVNAEGLGNE